MNNEEHRIQSALFKWAGYVKHELPEIQLMFAIPNGGARNAVTGAMLKAEGVKAGVPDIFLPVARGGYHGLFLEVKTKTGKLSTHQKNWIELLIIEGYCADVAYGLDEAMQILRTYLIPINQQNK